MLEKLYLLKLSKGDKKKPRAHAEGDADEKRDGERDG